MIEKDLYRKYEIEEAVSAWNKSPDADKHFKLRSVLSPDLFRQVARKKRTAIATEALVRNLDTYFEAFLRNDHEQLASDISNLCLDILLDGDNLQKYLESKKAEQMLAWFCCDHSSAYLYGDADDKYMPMFRDLLKRWTNFEIAEDIHLDTPFVANLLYGKAAWDIYGCDTSVVGPAEEIRTAVSNIVLAGLPLIFKTAVTAKPDDSCKLPDNLDLT